MESSALNTFLTNMPKVELHIHLEGSIPFKALWELVKKYNGQDEVRDIDEMKKRFVFKDFPHFIETWIWKNKFIREYEDFTFIASETANDLKSQNIKYAEMFYSPSDFKDKGLTPSGITGAVSKGLKSVEGIKINLVTDLIRDFGPENAMRVLEEINEIRNPSILGIGIGGSEHSFPPAPFRKVYEKARSFGLKTSVHAGEAAGSESIWDALKILKADRIGHAARAYEDESLINYLKEKQIPLEMCPLSNVRTGVVNSIENHPVKEYYQKGLKVFLNTDDPKMFHNTLCEEYTMFIEKMGFDIIDVKKLVHNAIDSAWCSEDEKNALRIEINNYFQINTLNIN